VIVETSALVAILAHEPERATFIEAIRADPGPKMSAANYLEAAIIVDRRSSSVTASATDIEIIVEALDIEIVPFTAPQARIARDAYSRFGKGSGHPAQLNFGDCFAYALVVETGQPLLYKSADFARAGIRPALER
jgi:ribonuclease VapC